MRRFLNGRRVPQMTREEAIKQLESLRAHCDSMYTGRFDSEEVWNEDIEALGLALSALRPVSRERVEKVWRGEWEDMREAYNDVPKRKCSRCKRVFIGLDTPFCEACGAPMTDEAVEMVIRRLEALNENRD